MNNMRLLIAPVYYTLDTVPFYQWCDREEALSDARQAPAAPPAAPRAPPAAPAKKNKSTQSKKRCSAHVYAESKKRQVKPSAALLQPFEVGVVYVCTRPCYSTYWECTKRTKCFITLRQLEDKRYQLTERRYKIGESLYCEDVEAVQIQQHVYLYPVVADPKDIPTLEVQQPVYPVFTVGTTYEHITHGGSSHSKYHQQYKCKKRTDFFVWFKGPEDTIRRKIHYYKDDSIYEDGEYVWPLKKEDQTSCPTPLRAVVSIEDLI